MICWMDQWILYSNQEHMEDKLEVRQQTWLGIRLSSWKYQRRALCGGQTTAFAFWSEDSSIFRDTHLWPVKSGFRSMKRIINQSRHQPTCFPCYRTQTQFWSEPDRKVFFALTCDNNAHQRTMWKCWNTLVSCIMPPSSELHQCLWGYSPSPHKIVEENNNVAVSLFF